MLKKMRARMIGAAMLAFSAVIVLIALLVNVVNYQVVTHRTDDTLSHILEYENHAVRDDLPSMLPPAPFRELPDLESNYMTRFFTVQFDEDGNVCSTSMDYIASIDKSDAVEYARTVLASGTSRGYTGDYRYQTASEGGKTTVCFLNTIREQQFMKELRTLTAEVALGSLVLVFLLVYLFSSRAIRPFESNIERQKQFITDASHELKTPLTSISTSIDVISLEHGEDEWTENIRKQTGRMTKLVGELVTLTRMNEGISRPNREVFSLSEAAWEIAEVYRPQAKAHGKELQLQIQESLSCFGEKTLYSRCSLSFWTTPSGIRTKTARLEFASWNARAGCALRCATSAPMRRFRMSGGCLTDSTDRTAPEAHTPGGVVSVWRLQKLWRKPTAAAFPPGARRGKP